MKDFLVQTPSNPCPSAAFFLNNIIKNYPMLPAWWTFESLCDLWH